jgi:hypothetical protein
MSPGWSETFDTPDLLKAAGVEYVYQWVVYAIEEQSSAEMKLRVGETIRTFAREIERERQPRVLTLPLHPHLSGVPHRIGFVAEMLDALMKRNDTVFMNGGQLAAWFVAESARLGLA